MSEPYADTIQVNVESGDDKRDAIIMIPGIGDAKHLSSAHVAEVLCHELDRAAQSEGARFVVRPASANSGDEVDVVRTISRLDGDTARPVVDLYSIDRSALQSDAVASNAFARTVCLAMTVLASFIVVVAAFFRANKKAKSLRQVLQLVFCLVILFVLGFYLILSIWALVQLAASAVAGDATNAEITPPQIVVVVGAVFATLVPKARDAITKTAEQYLRVVHYLWTSRPRNMARGEVVTLLERVAERSDIRKIHLIGFSFGSLIAIDVLFPASKPPEPRIQRINSLVTIGCPFDLVRMVQLKYFDKRFVGDHVNLLWCNIYEPTDVLGSNFRNDQRTDADPDCGVHCGSDIVKPELNLAWNPGQTLTIPSALMLASLRIHSQYWTENPRAESALGLVATALFGTTAVLA